MRHRWRPSTVALSIGTVIVLLTVGGYFFLQHSVDQQETALLAGNTTDVGATASSELGSITTGISSDAAVVKLTKADPAAFLNFVNPSEKNSPLNDVLVRRQGDNYVVVASSGSAFTPGQALSGPALATVQKVTGTGVISGPVTSNGKTSYGRFAATASGNYYVYEQFMIPVHINIQTVIGHAFNSLNVALYGPGPLTSSNLLITSTNELPLAKSARAPVHIGASTWTVVANARTPFVSGLASSGPWILLVMGLFIALVVTLTIETVQRRHRYAQALVEERTADLNSSLHELKTTQNALVQQERLSAVGEMASVIGHELRNPLAAVTNALFIVRGDLGEDVSQTTEKYLSMAERETSKAAVLADDLTAFVRPRELVESEINVSDLVDEVLSATPHPEDVRVNLEVAPCSIVGDRGQLAEVLTNLVTNAYQAMPDGGTVRLGASCTDGHATFTVEDSGNGIKDAALQRVFEPFFTTKDSGTGLGLAIVQRLVQAHGGEISLENATTGGVRATVVLPVKELAK